MVQYTWRGSFESDEVEVLHSAGFGRPPSFEWDWWQQVTTHSLGWVCARDGSTLVGWVNVAWDGGVHAFLIDAVVAAPLRRQGIARQMVGCAQQGALEAGCEWLHVDFEPELRGFYLQACGFTATDAGLISLG